jgi:hypothetical protein
LLHILAFDLVETDGLGADGDDAVALHDASVGDPDLFESIEQEAALEVEPPVLPGPGKNELIMLQDFDAADRLSNPLVSWFGATQRNAPFILYPGFAVAFCNTLMPASFPCLAPLPLGSAAPANSLAH